MSSLPLLVIYHRPSCITSRKVLALLLAHGHAPEVIDYVKVGFTEDVLKGLLTAMKVSPRDLLRVRNTKAADLGLVAREVSDHEILAAMVRDPELVERPIVVSSKGAVLARPPEKVLAIL